MFSFLQLFFDFFYPAALSFTPAYKAASEHLSKKSIRGEEIIVFIIFGVIAVVFIVFLIFVYFKERKKPRY